MRPDYDNQFEYYGLKKFKYQDKKLWAFTFQGILKKLHCYVRAGWVVKDRITSAHIGYTCKMTKKI